VVCFFAHRLLREAFPPPGLTPGLKRNCEPRSRRHLPEEALSEGTRVETDYKPSFENPRPLFAKRMPAAESRPDFLCAAGPPRADEESRPPKAGPRQ
jgi:hypothetical protein